MAVRSVGNRDIGAMHVRMVTLGRAPDEVEDKEGDAAVGEVAHPNLELAEGAEGEDRNQLLGQPMTIDVAQHYLFSYVLSAIWD